jgi:nitronate monooxygenase
MALPPDIRARLTLPAVVAPMFLCSGPALAAAACKAGLVGSLTRNHCRDIEELRAQLASVSGDIERFRERHPDRIIGPLAVNISTHFAADDMRAHLALCKSFGASIVITSVGDPTAVAPLVREAGLRHFHDATSIRFAEKAVAAGVDGIVAIGAGGGGHSGAVSHLALVPQIRAMFDGTVVLAGAVSTGAAIRAAEVLGADLAYMGSRFIATRESSAPESYKAMLVEGASADVIYTPGINGIPASWLKASIRSVGLDPERLPP